MNEQVLKRLVKARATLLIEQPFFGALALRLKLTPMPPEAHAVFKSRGLKPTLAVDGSTIYYDENFVMETEIPLLRSAVAHEVGHCVFDHMTRRGSREPAKWNIAADYVVNDMIVDAGFQLGEHWVQPNPAWKNFTADQIYNLLPDQPKGDRGQDVVLDGSGDEDEAEAQRDEWRDAVMQAAHAAKSAGKLPASLQRFVDELTTSKVDWRAVLRRFVTERTKDDYSWSRPNRRMLAHGLILPGMYSESMGELVTVIDTSGSIDQATLTAFATEIEDIRSKVRPRKTIVMYCDAAVNHVDEFLPEDEFFVKPHGGGGTDFRPPFYWLEKHSIEPKALIYLTDMYGTFPDAPVQFPVLWCATTDTQGPWGETVRLEL
jgi:predicted metal-dependent peptidase